MLEYVKWYIYFLPILSLIVTTSLVVLEYLKNEYSNKTWFSKSLSFFAELMIYSFLMAVIYTFFPSSKSVFLVTITTLPFLSALISMFTNKYCMFLPNINSVREMQKMKLKQAFERSSERAIEIKREKEERKKRLESRRIARNRRK